MKPMTPDQARRWEQNRERGKTRYVLAWGVLAYGMPMVVFWSFFIRYTAPELGPGTVLITNLVIHLTCGFLLGILMWNGGERRYLKFKRRHPASGPSAS
ncbi:MAG: hypothetical protein EOP85_13710 [Verrucomicrobiaceae bacterium]|nr:MAG: hypothetical protein EOP85_13710 [Verrucomicrobiaceae bacterium]